MTDPVTPTDAVSEGGDAVPPDGDGALSPVRSPWRVYTGHSEAEPASIDVPEAPPWRRFDDDARPVAEDLAVDDAGAGATFRPTPEMVDAVNAALHLRRPLLLTGRPGSGKSSLIEAVARELMLGRVLRWHVTSGSTLSDALYRYDAIGRLHAQSLRDAGRRALADDAVTGGQPPAIEGYLRLGPLGTALLPSRRPRALLIDEIDKSDIDLPNDLLNVFERGEYTIPELARLDRDTVTIRVDGGDETADITRGRVRCREFPFVVLTSNGERDFPAPFLRRCIRLRMPDPTVDLLTTIVEAHLGADVAERATQLIADFAARAEQSSAYSADQLMNALFLVSTGPAGQALTGDEEARSRVQELVLKKLTADPA
jgi:MoxR-like ATPase